MNKPQSPPDAERKKQAASMLGADAKTNAIFRGLLIRWFKRNGRDLPWRRTHDPYAILVSEIMCQQTQVATVVPYYERWLKLFPDIQTLAQADEQSVLHAWQGLGYYSRGRNLHRAALQIVRNHASRFPRALDAIRALSGVGRYTAGAVATFAFDQSTPIVDANIARVLARLLDMQTLINTRAGSDTLWRAAADLQPSANARLFNSALMELGALICTPHAPKCSICPVVDFCAAREPKTLPHKKPRRATIELIENCAFVCACGKVLLEQQIQSRWRGLWKLPVLAQAPKTAPLLELTYPFTHHRITLRVFPQPSFPRTSPNQNWFSLPALETVPMPSPHWRALRATLTFRIKL